ncbi:hypothetical protein [Photorhabdus sp. SF281]|uniref:hypothetical protein n=1 Tax=Photorhabdus sp. SF281 TaxID=3459527 RepID=UPI00404487D7
MGGIVAEATAKQVGENMNNITPAIIFDHSRYKLKVWKNTAPLDVVAFSGLEGLSRPFRYVIEFTSPEKEIKPAQMLMRDAVFTLTSPAINPGMPGMPVIPPAPLRTIYGVRCVGNAGSNQSVTAGAGVNRSITGCGRNRQS